MPATRSRTSTEAPEVAVDEVKKSEDSQQNEEAKESTNIVICSDSDEQTKCSTTDENEKSENEVESEENVSSDANDVNEAKDSNGETKDQSEEKVENGSSKRKSEAGEGDGPDSTDITPKKVKVDETSDAVAEDGDAPQLEATV